MAAFESPEWREERLQRLREWVGDEDAIDLLLSVGDAVSLWDDLIDQDKEITAARVNRVFRDLLVTLPSNPFFVRFRQPLTAILAIGINAWHDANEFESRGGETNLARAYMLRDYYQEILQMCVMLVHGEEYLRSVSVEMRDFFAHGETFDEFREEHA